MNSDPWGSGSTALSPTKLFDYLDLASWISTNFDSEACLISYLKSTFHRHFQTFQLYVQY